MTSTNEIRRSFLDYFGAQGRVRAGALFVTARPERLRFDVVSPFGMTLSTVTSDCAVFALLDVPGKTFFTGEAVPCNLARFLRVPVPPHALVALLAGQAPVLVHQPGHATIAWDSGRYVVRVAGAHGAREEMRLAVRPEDWPRPWEEQRLRLERVRVVQQGTVLYDVELDGHAPVRTARPSVDPDGMEPDVPPSGPSCEAEVPRRLRIVSEVSGEDVVLAHGELAHNPPTPEGTFQQVHPGGVRIRLAACR